MAKIHILSKVIEERRLGVSLSDLSKKYKVAKSTVSLWCKDVQISEEAKGIIKGKWLKDTTEARNKGTQANRDKRIKSIQGEYIKAKEIIGQISDRDLLIMGIGLYWAEGSKKETGSGFSFINSDHLMVLLIYKWLMGIMKIRKDELIINLSINASHKERELEILKFWSKLLDFPLGNFGNTTFIKVPHLKQYNNHTDYFGMLRIKVRSSAWLRRRVLGMIKVFTEQTPV